jgi:hypothetical protein
MNFIHKFGDKQKWVVSSLEKQVNHLKQSQQALEEEEEAEEPGSPVHVKHHPTFPKQRKRPVPWSEAEESFLVKLISEKGTTWAEFERDYGRNRLFNRDQTAIKDKARNMMRKIIDEGNEEEFLERCPKWRQVTVGSSRRGVHGYSGGNLPKVTKKRGYMEMVGDEGL